VGDLGHVVSHNDILLGALFIAFPELFLDINEGCLYGF